MSTADAVAGVLWIGATLYAVFGGADFGAGLWALITGSGERGRRARGLVDWAIGPVWEANHVWLIFVLVVLWTSFPDAFASVMSTLFIPLSLAALGIVLRGSGFAFHEQARRLRYRRFAELLFDVSSLLTPFFMGTVVGAIASGQVPVGNAAGDPVSSWTGAAPLITGALFVATGACLSAVFLVSDARRAHDPDMERYFATRALAAAVVAGAIAVAGLARRRPRRFAYDSSSRRPSVCSGCCGPGTFVTPVCSPRLGERAASRAPSARSIGGAKPESEVRTSPATACFDRLRPSICARRRSRRAAGSAMPTGSSANI